MDIRKADSKGRMTGFTPGAYYRIWKEGGFRFKADKVTLLESEEAYLNATEDGRPPEAAQNYLRRFGIEPSSVSVEDLMELGYTSFVLDENGKRINDYGVFKTERKPWPEGFSWNEFVGLLVDTP